MASITATTAAVDIDQMWTPELNRAVMLDTVVAGLFEDRSSQLPHGNILNLPSRHNSTANTKSAGTDLTPEAITETSQTFTVSTQKACAQEIEDFAEIQSRYDLRAETTLANSYALARAMDVDAAALFTNNTTQSVGTLGSELSQDNLLRARQYIRDSGGRPPFIGVVAPATYNGMLKIEQFTSNDFVTGPGAIEEAKLGKLYNCNFFESQLLTGTAPNADGAWFIKGHYFKIIQRQPSTHTWYSPLAVSWIVSMDCIYGMFERLEADEAAAATTNNRLYAVRLRSAK